MVDWYCLLDWLILELLGVDFFQEGVVWLNAFLDEFPVGGQELVDLVSAVRAPEDSLIVAITVGNDAGPEVGNGDPMLTGEGYCFLINGIVDLAGDAKHFILVLRILLDAATEMRDVNMCVARITLAPGGQVESKRGPDSNQGDTEEEGFHVA